MIQLNNLTELIVGKIYLLQNITDTNCVEKIKINGFRVKGPDYENLLQIYPSNEIIRRVHILITIVENNVSYQQPEPCDMSYILKNYLDEIYISSTDYDYRFKLYINNEDYYLANVITPCDEPLSGINKSECSICYNDICYNQHIQACIECKKIFHYSCVNRVKICPLCRKEPFKQFSAPTTTGRAAIEQNIDLRYGGKKSTKQKKYKSKKISDKRKKTKSKKKFKKSKNKK
jgi:hypothetical protein